MASLTDKLPAQDFNVIFKNDELAKELSQLIEKAKKNNRAEIRYSRDELMDIRKSPLCKISKSAFNARLARSNLSDNIVYSLLRKNAPEKTQNQLSNSQEDLNGDFFEENAQNYNRYKNNNARNVNTRDNVDSYRENVMNARYDREKSYRPKVVSESEAAQCWRTDKNLANNSSSNGNNNNSRPKREQFQYQYQDRYSQPRKFDRYNQRNNYNNRNGNSYRDEYEEEPEWLSNGPESMNDFIELKGFDDDEKCAPDYNDTQQFSGKRNSQDSGRNSGDPIDSSKNESFNRNVSDMSSMLNMDVSNMFNSPNVSFLENKDINDFSLPFSFGDLNSSNSSSRADKWFKNKKESISAEDSLQNVSKTTSPLTVGSDKSGSIMDLFQNVNMKQFPQPTSNLTGIRVDMSKATNLADLEASLMSSGPAKKNENQPQNGSSHDSSVLSKLFSLAGQHETKSNIQNEPAFNPQALMAAMNNQYGNQHEQPFGKPLNEPVQVQNNNPPMYPNFNQMAGPNMNRPMLPPNFFKGNGPMPPFPFPENNMPFPMDNNMHQRPAPFFGHPIPPELAHQMMGPNAFMPPGFMPNGPYPPPLPHPMMMNGPPGHQFPPHIAQQLLAHYNAVMQQPGPMAPDVNKPKNDDSNLADKLLKNSKFTPTSVFRKLKDHDQTSKAKASILKPEMQAKSELEMLSAAARMSESMDMRPKDPMVPSAEIRGPNTIPHPLSNYHHQLLNDKNSNEMANLLQQLNMNRAHNQTHSLDLKPNSISVNPSDIFSAMKKNEHSAATMDLPPLPLKNALKLEDLEKF